MVRGMQSHLGSGGRVLMARLASPGTTCCDGTPRALRTHRLVPADGHPGARLAAGAREGEVAWFAPMVPVAAPLDEPQRGARLEPVLGGGDRGVCVLRVCTAAHVCVHLCICVCRRGWCDLPPPPRAPAHLGTLAVPPGQGEAWCCPGTEAAHGGPVFTLSVRAWDTPSQDPPRWCPQLQTRSPGSPFSPWKESRGAPSAPRLRGPHGAVWSWCQHRGVAPTLSPCPRCQHPPPAVPAPPAHLGARRPGRPAVSCVAWVTLEGDNVPG